MNSSRRSLTWALVALVILALALRLLGLWWGLPNSQHHFSYHPDEIFLLLPSFGFAQGDLNPHFFNYGTLYLYLVGLPAAALGLVPEPEAFPAGLRPLYLEARLLTALLGAATVLLLYLALRREALWLAGLSALLLAVCPLHVVNSHYATVDVPATFFLLLAFLFALQGADAPRPRLALLTGLAVGLAAATKYNSALFLPIALLAPLFGTARRFPVHWWLLVPAGTALGFLLGNPFVANPEFLRGFLFELRHAQAGGTLAFVNTGSGWAYHFLHGLPVALGYPLLAASLVGLLAAFFRGPAGVRLSLLWVLLYFAAIGFGKERFIRYLVPLMPFLCVLAAWGLMWLIRLAKRPPLRELMAVLGLLVLLLTGFYTLGQVGPLIFPDDPRDVAWQQTDSDVLPAEPDATFGLVSLPWYFDPPVSPYNAGPFSRRWFEDWNRAHGDRVIITGWSAERLTVDPPTAFFLSALETADPVRLHQPDALEFIAALDAGYSSRITFWRAPAAFAWLAPGWSWAPPDWLYPSPRITGYYRWSE